MLLGAWPRFGSSRGSRSRSGDGRSRTQFTNRPTPITNTIEAVKMEGRVLLTLLFMLHSALCALRVNSSVDVKIYSYVQGDTSRCAKPPVAFKTKVLFWPGLAWPGLAWSAKPRDGALRYGCCLSLSLSRCLCLFCSSDSALPELGICEYFLIDSTQYLRSDSTDRM